METALNKKSANEPIKLVRTLPPGQKSTNFTPVPIGVVDVPKMATSPIKDRLERAKQENVKVVLSTDTKKPTKSVRLMELMYAALIGAGVVFSVDGAMKMVRKIKSFLK